MLKIREQMEEQELGALAPYAQKSSESFGRKYVEPPHPYRTAYQRDRARIIHSRAFRRLEYKTQVFLNGTGDHLRTRLTHTIEVASISRTIARALALNEDLAEAIALAHDLGHPPFGHSGEKMLASVMAKHGGFEHNMQSLRIVELIESKYPNFKGLNLSFEVLEGLKKHHRFYQTPSSGKAEADGEIYTNASLEAQIANLADEITYYSHDLDDGLDFDLIDPEQLRALRAWDEPYSSVRSHFPKMKGKELTGYVIRCMIDHQVQDVILTSSSVIEKSKVESARDVRLRKKPLICYSKKLLEANRELRRFLYQNLYYHPRVADANKRACTMLKSVFDAYIENPRLLGEAAAKRIRKEGLHRTVCDYLAGMTDRYLLEEHARISADKVLSAAKGKARSTKTGLSRRDDRR